MDLARPISTVVPSLDGPVLEVLARTTTPLTGRRIHQLAETGSEAGVRRVLARLAEAGLVDVSEAGSSLLYTFNRDHIAAPAVEHLARLRSVLIERIRHEIDQWQRPPVHASLFGSAARGDGDVRSDIDILLVRRDRVDPDSSQWANQVGRLAEQVRVWTGNHAQIYDISVRELEAHRTAGEGIVEDWRHDAITLSGPDFRRLRRRPVRRSA